MLSIAVATSDLSLYSIGDKFHLKTSDARSSSSTMASHESQPDITLYRGFRGSGAYTWSPFVTKLEARLRFAGLSYHTEAGSLLQAPKGKIPYVAISRMDSGPMVLGDSTLIARKLIGDGLAEDLNANLSPTERAHDLAIRALLEEKLYFCVVCINPSPPILTASWIMPFQKEGWQPTNLTLGLRKMARELLYYASEDL
jgi:hypothetical protein